MIWFISLSTAHGYMRKRRATKRTLMGSKALCARVCWNAKKSCRFETNLNSEFLSCGSHGIFSTKSRDIGASLFSAKICRRFTFGRPAQWRCSNSPMSRTSRRHFSRISAVMQRAPVFQPPVMRMAEDSAARYRRRHGIPSQCECRNSRADLSRHS